MRPSEKLLHQSLFFLKLAEELPANSKNLKTILKNIESLDNYNSRKEYAEKNLTHLSSGSSRIVYQADDNTIIKLAKNDKGLAQNKVEANPKMKSKYLNKIISHAKDFSWIQTYFLEKLTTKQFEEMTGISFEDFGNAISYALKHISESSDKKPKNFEKVEKSEFFKEIKRLGKEFNLLSGDLTRISSFKTKNNLPILADAGLTKDIYKKYYDSSKSSS